MKKYLEKRITIVSALIVALIVAGASFYGGDYYAKSKIPTDDRLASGQQTNGRFGGGGVRGARGGGFIGGEIAERDATGITIKSPDGSSRIVLVAPSTQILKSVTGTPDDLRIGINVLVGGSTNSDGSITAQSIQIRPARTSPQTK